MCAATGCDAGPGLRERQLAALAAAAGGSAAKVAVMAPMIATVAEAQAFVAAGRAAGLERLGVMVDIPALALVMRADQRREIS